ncbi:MAG: DUF4145 domain-containing protein, partial [Labilithrix sp.]|nr:DUF4145 domain-containing protein [Labilithrix sp.]
MDKPNTFAKGTCDGRKHRLQCISCDNITLHTVQASMTDTEHVMEKGVEIGSIDTDHELVQCDGCQTISYREFWCTSNEDPEYHELPPERQRLFPPRLEGRRRIMFKLPDEVEAIYAETYWALCSGSPILAGMGIRATLETVCRKKGAKTGKLVKKIEKLVDLGVLSKNDAKALHRLRDLGNEAAHKVKQLDSVSLGVAMNVVEHLLRQVYYVDGAVVRKHLPRKRWPTSKAGAAKRKAGKGPASLPTTSPPRGQTSTPARPSQGAP